MRTLTGNEALKMEKGDEERGFRSRPDRKDCKAITWKEKREVKGTSKQTYVALLLLLLLLLSRFSRVRFCATP